MPQDSKKLFDNLVEIKNIINNQIPLASNRYEDFECFPEDQNERDVEIQFILHEQFIATAHLEHAVYTHLNEYFEKIRRVENITDVNKITELQKIKIKSTLEREAGNIFAKCKRTQEHVKRRNISYLEIKEFLQTNLSKLYEAFCTGNPLIIDDKQIATQLKKKLQDDVLNFINKIKNQQKLTEKDINFAYQYRRQNSSNESKLNYFYQWISDNETTKITPDSLLIFQEEAFFNIEQLYQKICNRKESEAIRYEKDEELVTFREMMTRQFLVNTDNFTLDDIEQDKAEAIEKANTLWTGLFYERLNAHVGYCGEHTARGLKKIFEEYIQGDASVEKITIDYYDGDGNKDDNHCFVAFNRDSKSDLNDISSWGEDAILFDPWNKLVIFAKDYSKLANQYFSYPKDAKWTVTKFTNKDSNLLHSLINLDLNFAMTGNQVYEERLPLLMQEYHLTALDQGFENISAFLKQVIDQVKPENFALDVKFFITTSSSELIKPVLGFKTPAVAIHKQFFEKLCTGEYSLDEFKFAIAEVLAHIKYCGAGMTNLVSADLQHHRIRSVIKIDIAN